MTRQWERLEIRGPAGVRLEGEMWRDRFDITVRILAPFSGLSTGRHIPTFAGGVLSYAGDAGSKRGNELLEDLYVLARALKPKLRTLRAHWLRVRPNVPALHAIDSTFRSARSELRARFKRGELDQRAYQQALAHERKHRDNARRLRWELVDAFFETHCREIRSHDLREQVLRVVEGEIIL